MVSIIVVDIEMNPDYSSPILTQLWIRNIMHTKMNLTEPQKKNWKELIKIMRNNDERWEYNHSVFENINPETEVAICALSFAFVGEMLKVSCSDNSWDNILEFYGSEISEKFGDKAIAEVFDGGSYFNVLSSNSGLPLTQNDNYYTSDVADLLEEWLNLDSPQTIADVKSRVVLYFTGNRMLIFDTKENAKKFLELNSGMKKAFKHADLEQRIPRMVYDTEIIKIDM